MLDDTRIGCDENGDRFSSQDRTYLRRETSLAALLYSSLGSALDRSLLYAFLPPFSLTLLIISFTPRGTSSSSLNPRRLFDSSFAVTWMVPVVRMTGGACTLSGRYVWTRFEERLRI